MGSTSMNTIQPRFSALTPTLTARVAQLEKETRFNEQVTQYTAHCRYAVLATFCNKIFFRSEKSYKDNGFDNLEALASLMQAVDQVFAAPPPERQQPFIDFIRQTDVWINPAKRTPGGQLDYSPQAAPKRDVLDTLSPEVLDTVIPAGLASLEQAVQTFIPQELACIEKAISSPEARKALQRLSQNPSFIAPDRLVEMLIRKAYPGQV